MENSKRTIKTRIDYCFDKINTNSEAGMIYELMSELCLDDEKPYTKAREEFSKAHELDLLLLSKKNLNIFKGIQIAFAIIDRQYNVEFGLTKALNNYPDAKKYYEYLYNAYNRELGKTDSKYKVVSQKNKELVLTRKK